MTKTNPYNSFTRYLSSKKSVDDRALNRLVWESLQKNVQDIQGPLRILEVGAGIGTMIERVLDWNLYEGDIVYTALDSFADNIEEARKRIPNWMAETKNNLEVNLIEGDFYDYAHQTSQKYDLVIANAFLDLVNLDEALPALFGLLDGKGAYYFTINFDGMTLFEPTIDPGFDIEVERAYHQTMDDRITDGKTSGDSHTGRIMYHSLKSFNAQVTAAGASDWVVIPQGDSYLEDEAYFLHFIVETVHGALKDSPQLDAVRFQSWIAERHAQVERGELVYIAHQIDYTGTYKS